MKKLLTAICVAAVLSAPAQTLFTYGKDVVSAPDFLRAFQKNNQGPVTEKTLREYLDLYIASRLKIKEARDAGYDTLPQLVADLANLRQQILPTYLNDKESLEKMTSEAFSRSQKDIRLAHIFIKAGDGAEQKKAQVLQALGKGDFATIARQYSDDPAAKTNGGDLGWITVFSLPYELENLAYNTPAGKTSAVYQSRAGFHIFRNLGERKALGRVKAAQILLAIPPNSTAATKARLKQTADSLYRRLIAGGDFGKLATAYSNDVISAASNGQMAEFGVGEYDAAFEDTVLKLPKDGVISKPFLTAHGYHIVKRLRLTPVSARLDDNTKESLRTRIGQSDRTEFLKSLMAQSVLKKAGYRKLSFSDAELQAYTDSVLSYQAPQLRISLQPSTPLLTIGAQKATVAEWTEFAQTARLKRDGSGARPYAQLWDEFVQSMALNYYQEHLEEFNEDFRRQINEFAEGNLFFEIMQREVWTKAQADSAALAAYFQQHKNEYTWKESADAVLFFGSDEAIAKEFYNTLRKRPADWRTTLANYSEQISADSNRFELAQIPGNTKQSLAKGALTMPVVNKADNTVSFAYVLQLHPKPEPRTFQEAKGLVINDYQAQLEKEWVEKLKKKYPVSVDERVWSEVVKKAASPNSSKGAAF
jgi:peptidyl-prolyl cis-trans isomerase SurA